MPLQTLNPATGELVKTFDEASEDQLLEIIEKTHATFLEWRRTTFAERSKLMFNAAKVLRDNVKK
ncbi:MAG: aldehyde dehydrogenase family protein, partial [Chlorobi bacterium]|nr:aldehyde dehydrogenase family protein [Chlorobiota bacterium]